MSNYSDGNLVEEGLYDMEADVLITPVGMIRDMEHVELRIAGEFIGEYSTYTQACETVIRIVNQIGEEDL